jgi:hypothetical protein
MAEHVLRAVTEDLMRGLIEALENLLTEHLKAKGYLK